MIRMDGVAPRLFHEHKNHALAPRFRSEWAEEPEVCVNC